MVRHIHRYPMGMGALQRARNPAAAVVMSPSDGINDL
jgi:hypothetical protein